MFLCEETKVVKVAEKPEDKPKRTGDSGPARLHITFDI